MLTGEVLKTLVRGDVLLANFPAGNKFDRHRVYSFGVMNVTAPYKVQNFEGEDINRCSVTMVELENGEATDRFHTFTFTSDKEWPENWSLMTNLKALYMRLKSSSQAYPMVSGPSILSEKDLEIIRMAIRDKEDLTLEVERLKSQVEELSLLCEKQNKFKHAALTRRKGKKTK